ncbi:LemA family protein [bacterium]|nr:LemA family protein [bacterium]
MIVAAAVLALICIPIIVIYNQLVKLRNQTRNGFYQIDVQLQRRTDLIPNLVETVKGYVKHERETLEAVIQARSALQQAGTPAEKARANDALTSALKSLFAVVEAYPQLQANENFLRLQEEIASTENQIAFARQFYNDMVMKLNTAMEIFPNNVIAGMFHFELFVFFGTEGGSGKVPKVKF